jgi:hypothetical protein
MSGAIPLLLCVFKTWMEKHVSFFNPCVSGKFCRDRTLEIPLNLLPIFSYVKYNEGRLTALVTSCIGTALYNTLLKGSYKGR